MRCPFCGADDTQVKDSRPTDDRGAIRRRRFCGSCAARFTTFERVQLRELTVLKKNNQREPFDREKLARSIYVALRKRPVEPERVERMINSLVRQLESSGDTEIRSEQIGEEVMAALQAALALARRGLGTVWPNPSVGCVIVKDGRVVGRGSTRPGGRPHGETEALRRAGGAA